MIRLRVASLLVPVLLLGSIFATGKVAAAIREVPTEYETIQAAVDAATDGDTVVVAPGIYVETINYHGKAITVTSAAGPEVTIIDGNRTGSVVTFASGEGLTSVLNGFTLRNGRGEGFGGGGVWINMSSPTITNNIITGNEAGMGGGIGVTNDSSPTIQGNVIVRNTATGSGGSGGGINLAATTVQLLDNDISNNIAPVGHGGGVAGNGLTGLIRGNTIRQNSARGLAPSYGGGIYLLNQMGGLSIHGNLITGNSADRGGGIYLSVVYGAVGFQLVNNTIAANNAQPGSGIYAIGFDDAVVLQNNIVVAAPPLTAVYCDATFSAVPPTFQFNDVFNATGAAFDGACGNPIGTNGNLSVDPLFVDASQGNYHLRPESPCIDAGTNLPPDLPTTDLDQDARVLDGKNSGNPVVDIGVDEFNPAAPSLTVTTTGDGIGTITSTPGGIACGSACNASFPPGTGVTLTPITLSGFAFAGWGGGCSGTGPCTVLMSAAQTVSATFVLATYSLSITLNGTGTGVVTSNPSGITCSAWDNAGACSAVFTAGTVVTLTAAPATGSTFTGWSGGGCSGTGTCKVTLSQAQAVAATFMLPTKADLTTPTPGTQLTSSTVTFGWNTGTSVSEYYLEVGSTLGGTNYYGQTAGTNLSATVSGLPTNGSTLYVRLWSKLGTRWAYGDYTYTAAGTVPVKADLTTPTPGTQLTSSTVTFGWNTGTSVSGYYLEVGNAPYDTAYYGQSAGTNLSATVTGLPTDGHALNVRLQAGEQVGV